MKKCILIDAYAETITEVTIGDEIEDIYAVIGCDMFECINIDRYNTIYVDEEGLLKLNPFTKFFSIAGGYQPYAGNGLVMGFVEETGESSDTNLTLEQLQSVVKFHTLNEVREIAKKSIY